MLKKRTLVLITLFAIGMIQLYCQTMQLDNHLDKVKIGTTYMTMNNSFYQTLNAEIKRQLPIQDYRLVVRDAEFDDTRQSQQINDFIRQKVKMIVINPVKSDSEPILKALQKAKKKGIKIIVVDSQLAKASLSDTTIVSDNYLAGTLIAKQMMAKYPKARIVLLEHQEAISAKERIQGFLDTIKGKDAYDVVAREDTSGQTETGMPKVAAIIDQGISFDVVMALNDKSALGALAAIKDKQITQAISIYGVDGSPDMKKILAETQDIAATVAQSPLQIGAKTAEVIKRLQANKSVKAHYTIPVTLITKDTIETYDRNGWQ
ncbi:substrate-binding domain-containing protein [Streptococcus sp. zg-JUN1979]|uniref:substrate-binding domain-containing protein n=1 Tax=Streptococcus sp. zg-JUN1979 TaxID=3391450 RepID=UPI0039B00E0F